MININLSEEEIETIKSLIEEKLNLFEEDEDELLAYGDGELFKKALEEINSKL